jgi:hypothetical protein
MLLDFPFRLFSISHFLEISMSLCFFPRFLLHKATSTVRRREGLVETNMRFREDISVKSGTLGTL